MSDLTTVLVMLDMNWMQMDSLVMVCKSYTWNMRRLYPCLPDRRVWTDACPAVEIEIEKF